jgi:hypothetical protein
MPKRLIESQGTLPIRLLGHGAIGESRTPTTKDRNLCARSASDGMEPSEGVEPQTTQRSKRQGLIRRRRHGGGEGESHPLSRKLDCLS